MKNDVQKLRSALVSGVGSVSCVIVAIAFLLSSCNLLFLDLGYEDEAPEFEQLAVIEEDIESATLWPTFQATIYDDTGIASVSCSVLNDDGETKSLTIERTNERERYVWRVSGSLADLVSIGDNTLTFTATDLEGNTFGEDESLYFGTDVWELHWNLDRSQTPWVITFWHPAGITDVTYIYESDTPTYSVEYALDNIDDGTGEGGDKLFKGTMVQFAPNEYSDVRFQITTSVSTLEKLIQDL